MLCIHEIHAVLVCPLYFTRVLCKLAKCVKTLKPKVNASNRLLEKEDLEPSMLDLGGIFMLT